MRAEVKKAWLVQLSFPLIQYAVFLLIAYISVYWFENYDRKFDKAGAFGLYLDLIALVTVITSILYSITFLSNAHSIWNQLRSSSWLTLSLPVAVSSLIQVGLFFPFEKLGMGILLWFSLIPPLLAWFSVKFISEEQQPEVE